MLVGLGMTLVIATPGVDLSVGAVAAISGAAATMFLQGTGDPNRVLSNAPKRVGDFFVVPKVVE